MKSMLDFLWKTLAHVLRFLLSETILSDAFKTLAGEKLGISYFKRISRQYPDDILPQVILTVEFDRKLSLRQKRRIGSSVESEFMRTFEMWFPAGPSLEEQAHPYEFEVVVEDGSIVVRIRIAAVTIATVLSSYGCQQPKLTHVGNDIRRATTAATEQTYEVIDKTLQQDLGEHAAPRTARGRTDRSYGAIVNVDDILNRYERNEIQQPECLSELAAEFKNMRKSAHWDLLVQPLVRYIDYRYGILFDWASLRGMVSEIGERPAVYDLNSICLVTVRIDMPKPLREETVKEITEIVREVIGAHVDDGGEKVELVHESQLDDSSIVLRVKVVFGALLGLFVSYGAFRQAWDYLVKDTEEIPERIRNLLIDGGILEKEDHSQITFDNCPMLRLRSFLANVGESHATVEELSAKARERALEIEDDEERAAFEKLVGEYLNRKFEDAGTT